jgi:hypothetical protein
MGKVSFAVSATVAALAMAVAIPFVAFAEPPSALPASALEADNRFQPAFDYDGDGCYPTPAIGQDGTLNPGLKNSGALNGNCHDESDLDNTNAYVRSKCDNDWCAHLYDLYFEKDQAVAGVDCCGHRHDIEHVVIWVNQDQVKFVSTSAHGDFSTKPSSGVAFEGTHAKIVYHKDGGLTHAFRLASADEAPENHKGAWQLPALVGFDNFPAGIRDTLVKADFGSASLGIKDGAFESNLEKAKPEGISFDPRG